MGLKVYSLRTQELALGRGLNGLQCPVRRPPHMQKLESNEKPRFLMNVLGARVGGSLKLKMGKEWASSC